MSYELLNLITFPLLGTVTAHPPCHVTYHQRGAQMVHILKISVPNLLFTLSLSGRYTKDKATFLPKMAFIPL